MELYRATECRSAVLIASGPSVTQDQLDNVREWQEGGGGIVMVINRSFEAAPWADYLFTIDGKFLRLYESKIRDFKGTVITHQLTSYKPDFVKIVKATRTGNSGSAGIEVLIRNFRVQNLALVGCDAKHGDDGRKHHHSDYPQGDSPANTCSNASNIHEFKEAFMRAIKGSGGARIVNCSPDSALRFMEKLPIDQALESFNG